ncbi:MAG: right-handed parallel beta-helix repeat-containing protein [Candidatus Bathyarchaeaceae archaeon]
MLKKIISGAVLMFLLIGIVSLAFNISPAKAWTGTVYIKDDGSIQPQGAPITTYDLVTYTLTDNITSSDDGIVVESDNIIIDGAGYTVQGEGDGTGIELIERINVTVKNVIIKGFGYGIWLEGSLNNHIIGNNITYNDWAGIEIGVSSNNSRLYHNNL